jgi:hypothetical protein
MLVPTFKPTMFCWMSANIANSVFVFWCLEDDRWLQLLKNIFEFCGHGDMQKAFLVGGSKYLPASPLIDLIPLGLFYLICFVLHWKKLKSFRLCLPFLNIKESFFLESLWVFLCLKVFLQGFSIYHLLDYVFLEWLFNSHLNNIKC